MNNARVHSSYIDLEMEMPYIAEHACPGQFVMIRGWKGDDPILLRPFDVVQVNKERGSFRIVAKLTGRGTQLLGRLSPGERLRVLGPLGHPVELWIGFGSKAAKGSTGTERQPGIGFLVRGVGSAAVVYLVAQAHRLGIPTKVYFSASASQRLVCREYLEPLADELHIATDDGSEGYHGDARDILTPVLEAGEIASLYTCGSRRFARYVQDATKRGLTRGFLFLEGYMACGIGDCHGCAVKKAGVDDYYLVCQDGPVFAADSVELE